MDGDQLSAFLQQQQQGFDALLLCSSLFSTQPAGPGLAPREHPAPVDAELFDSFLDLDWSAIEQSSSGGSPLAPGGVFYPQALPTTLESSV